MDASKDALVEVEVEFDYDAELPDELTIKTGEIITDVKRLDGGWWEGKLKGKKGMFPDNFVKVLNRDSPKTTKPTTANQTTTSAPPMEEPVQLRRGQGQQRGSGVNKKKCRVLFSYQPKHEDELELKLDDVVDFINEVEDGWWKGKLKGRVGVFPSNFVEMITAADEKNVNVVADKNKKNERLKEKPTNVSRPSSKISSLIQEAESKAAKKVSTENLNLLRRESPLGGEATNTEVTTSASPAKTTATTNSIKDLANAPKLPPKPVKEQCQVIFPYSAVNEDELSLEEGQIINIVTKDVEDKGWWKGEVDGRVGVFPDNFVKMIAANNQTPVKEEMKSKKPTRPPSSTGLVNKLANKKGDSLEDVVTSSSNSSREKLNGSSEKITSTTSGTRNSLNKRPGGGLISSSKQPVSLPPSSNLTTEKASPKKHSFGKSTPPPKPKPPALSTAASAVPSKKTGSNSSLDKDSTSKERKSSFGKSAKAAAEKKPEFKKDHVAPAAPTSPKTKTSVSESKPEDDFDGVQRGDKKLAHPTADRVKAPKRRPPSSVFVKEAKLSGDAFEALEDVGGSGDAQIEVDVSDDSVFSTSLTSPKRSASQGSLHKEDSHLLSATRQESKNRLSFKMVKQQMKEVLGGLTNGDSKDNGVQLRKPRTASDIKKSAPEPTTTTEPEIKKEPEKEAKKPEWLAELSRKQANRRSGLFNSNSNVNNEDSNSNSNNSVQPPAPSSPTKSTPSSTEASPSIASTTQPPLGVKPSVISDKPHIPLKPSQIRDEARKSAAFPKRNSNENANVPALSTTTTTTSGSSNNNTANNDKENNRPSPTITGTGSAIPGSGPISGFTRQSSRKLSEDKVTSPTSETAAITKPSSIFAASKMHSSNTSTESAEVSEIAKPKQERKSSLTSPINSGAVGWKSSILQHSSSTESKPETVELDLTERVKRLESKLAEMQKSYEAKFETMSRELEIERTARKTVEKELLQLRRNH